MTKMILEADPYQGLSMAELIHDDEDGELSVLTCKAVTREISPLPGVFDAELIRNDEDRNFRR